MAPAPFIVGVGRSGTTLLRLMLDAHPALAIPGETLFLQDLIKRGAAPDSFVDIVTASETWPNMAMRREALERAVAGAASLSEAIRAFYRLYTEHRGKARWGDKTPYYRVYMKDIARLLPEAHFIHVIRDGRDSALSYQGLWFGPGDDFEKQARFWSEAVRNAQAMGRELARYTEIRYEALVAEPERTLRGLCAQLALDFDPAMLAYHLTAAERLDELKRPFGPKDRTPQDIGTFMAIHDRAKEPPDAGRIGRWRTEMLPADLSRYEAIAGPLLRELGYETGSQQ
ncbi:MAG: sulfotransferase [Alphaproteobacteria bacterium]|nr:sulfotransferase [Alphaproteobacteria bacterium]